MAEPHQWTFFSNHGHVLICLAQNAEQPLREVALSVGITERAVQRIVADLETGGYLERQKEGRRNRYRIRGDLGLGHRLVAHRTVGELLGVIAGEDTSRPRRARGLDNWRVGEHGSEIR